jgi:uncharacterized protein (DUF488 family)
MSGVRILLTIGHSNHSLEKFLELLRAHKISTLVDVRSWPSSRRMPHFNRAALEDSVAAAGICYLWFGKALGGKNDGDTSAAEFRNRISELAGLAESGQAAMMCAEEDPLRCHRKLLLAMPLAAHGIELLRIRGDGTLIADEALAGDKPAQLSLFEEG